MSSPRIGFERKQSIFHEGGGEMTELFPVELRMSSYLPTYYITKKEGRAKIPGAYLERRGEISQGRRAALS